VGVETCKLTYSTALECSIVTPEPGGMRTALQLAQGPLNLQEVCGGRRKHLKTFRFIFTDIC
jgi:hypothetical protein